MLILEILCKSEGRGTAKEVLDEEVEQKRKQFLSDADYYPNKNGTDVRWHNRAQWARFHWV